MSVVSNSGPIIHLSWIGQLDLLRTLFGEVLVPLAVRDEVLHASPDVPGLREIREAFTQGWLLPREAVSPLPTSLHLGEAEAIALAREQAADLLLVDERRGRATALREGLRISGTLGILRLARNRGLIPAVTPFLDELLQRGFRLRPELAESIRREESPDS